MQEGVDGGGRGVALDGGRCDDERRGGSGGDGGGGAEERGQREQRARQPQLAQQRNRGVETIKEAQLGVELLRELFARHQRGQLLPILVLGKQLERAILEQRGADCEQQHNEQRAGFGRSHGDDARAVRPQLVVLGALLRVQQRVLAVVRVRKAHRALGRLASVRMVRRRHPTNRPLNVGRRHLDLKERKKKKEQKEKKKKKRKKSVERKKNASRTLFSTERAP
jgi:hypothetical protein